MDSYPRCYTCKQWSPPADDAAWPHRGWCEALTEHDESFEGLIATSTDYSIYTSAEFGCILHEPKES